MIPTFNQFPLDKNGIYKSLVVTRTKHRRLSFEIWNDDVDSRLVDFRKEPFTYHENSLCKTILTMSPISQKPFLAVWFRSLLHSGLGDLRSVREFLNIPT
jgi:hypothetical protein